MKKDAWSHGVTPEVHETGMQPHLALMEGELDVLIHKHAVDAGRWGINPGGHVESPALYERAVTRGRYLQELKEAVTAAREAAVEEKAAA